EKLYELHTLSESGGYVCSSFDMEVSTEPLGCDEFDTILVGVGMEVPSVSPGMIAYLQTAAQSTRRLASICVAAFALGEAGILDGRRATTHWRYAAELQRRYPKCKVEMDRIFANDGRIWTSAGMSAAIDLGLGMVENDHGRDLARVVAASMVVHHRRAGGQSQHSALLDLDAKADKIQTALAYAKRNLHRPLNISELAQAASLSPRQFTRVFRSETGNSAAKAIEALRLEAAKLMLDQSRLSVETIAKETGFGNGERMRRAFIRVYGEPPRAIRSDAGTLVSI
ncbi:MAG: transcriptional regulator, AraC family, partial [Nevskia sp.]|nr:transcriptional regulator, AraC family [Nevskia sp.]